MKRTYFIIIILFICVCLPDLMAQASRVSKDKLKNATAVDFPTFSEYTFEETDSAKVYDAISGEAGMIINSIKRVDGIRGRAIEFTDSGFINLGPIFGDNVTEEVSLSAWVKPSLTGGWEGVMMHGGPILDTYGLYILPSIHMVGFKTSGTTDDWWPVEDVNKLWDGDWHLLTAVYDGTQKILYLDEDTLAKVEATGLITSGVGYNLIIGAGRDTISPTLLYNGLMDETRVFNYAISHDDVIKFYNQYRFTAKAMSAGGIASVDKEFAAFGDTVTFAIGTDEGYHLDSVLYNDINVSSEVTSGMFEVVVSESGRLNAYFSVDVITSVSVDENKSIQIFPNPNNGQFKVCWKNEYQSGLLFRVYNMQGELMQSIRTGPELKEVEMDLMHTSAGLYLIEIIDAFKGELIRQSKVMVR